MKLRKHFMILLNVGALPADDQEVRAQKALMVASSIYMGIGGIIWGILYIWAGEPNAALIPLAYSALTIISISLLPLTKNYNFFRFTQILLSLLLPFLLMLALGGFQASGAVILWSLVAPLGATLFANRREALAWFVAFAFLVFVSGLLEPIIARPNNLSPALVTAFFVLNILAASALAIFLLLYFLQEEQRILSLLKKEQARAESANQAKSAFLANMSHELRSPLNAILGFTQVMLRAPDLTEAQEENLGVIMRSGDHLLTLINQVLDLSKIEAGRMELVEQTFDLPAMLGQLEDMFSLAAADKGLRIEFERAAHVPQYVRLDDVKLRQVLINLLNNALKFTKEGGVSLRVDALMENHTGAGAASFCRLLFEVEDSGPGIAREDIEEMFAAFGQTDVGRKAGGAGLGLPISRQLVRLMGGDMHVSSKVGRGTIFHFDVQAAVESGSAFVGAEPGRRVIGLEPEQPDYRILIVDDKESNRQALFRLLEPVGFELQTAQNGREAVELWQEWQPHLIWMDVRMPVMDGCEATHLIKSDDKDGRTKIIALTASTFVEERTKIIEAGCDDMVRKPYRDSEIFEMMQRYLGVRYIYETAVEPAPAGTESQRPAHLTAASLGRLPSDWRDEMQEALINLDTQRMEQLIDELPPENKGEAKALSRMLDQFEYERVLELLAKSED